MDFEKGRLKVAGIGGTLREGSRSLAALRRALGAAAEAGAEVELLDLRELGLPMYEPGLAIGEYGENVERLIEAVRGAGALLTGAAAYHGTLAGVTKNALDFTRFLARGERPYLDGRVVGLISSAGGEQAAARTTDALVHVVHALRGVMAPLTVAILRAWRLSDDEGRITDENYGARLGRLGWLVVELAEKVGPAHGTRSVKNVGVAV